ncbi:MAG TPA: hypothetical protein VKR55_22455 [Bradyrhizobium sp.]|uniref:hypothetical protein n=1 Tax=Bradyrhizobium sp. TaxID=376 RepID=UPI002C18CD9C|nr:hypothetical protein [Bradyrhizobium sp.]HLZ04899.1 hypothetical protein [Bradyrhizobium sp.]
MASRRIAATRLAIFAFSCFSIAPVASAQNPASTPQPSEGQVCELHVWPAERFSAITTGWLGGGLIDAAAHAKGDRERKSSMADALDSPNQVAALASLDLAGLLHQQSATVIQHNEPLTRHTVNDIKTRRSESKSPCYSELIVADIFYQNAAIYGRSLKTLFIYREFGASPTATRIYKGWGGNGLKLFPPKPGEDAEAANNELVFVFKADFQEFARNEAGSHTASR